MNIVTIGGGKGQSELLRFLKMYDFSITSIVSTMDDGGSSGVIRTEQKIIPPGDIRRCIAALAEDSTLADRWNARDTNGHAVGNLEIVQAIQDEGSVMEAIKKLSLKYNVKGCVLPVSLNLVSLVARYDDGRVVHGESAIDEPEIDFDSHVQELRLNIPAVPTPGVLEAIVEANCIVFTMGDLYTSILPNLLVQGIPEAIAHSKARVLYVCNRTTKHGETHGFTSTSFIVEMNRYLSPGALDTIIIDDGSVVVPSDSEAVIVEDADDVELIQVDLSDPQKPERVTGAKAAAQIYDICASL